MTSQEDLDAKLRAQGYSHPDEVNSYHPQDTNYMSYSDGGNYKPQSTEAYAKFNSEQKTISKSPCPVCSKPALYSCSCELQDMLCGGGHTWYITKDGKIVIADPHEDED